ncbi:MAG: peroxide stress protein YaaA [Clostridia bacterium]|uniref:peroxide stress protein YaaA n=1 Tax=Ruminococcus sp. JE7B6 TaxID=3233380 RepID=UPI00292D36C9|nr:peroxide stress protein YaaA [uncultured Ruminococcus sp.]MBQ1398409.1 peroxide stress protein YaaA [Clostridia bacterium]
MRIIIAPAKQMKEDTNTLPYAELPVFLDKAERLKNYVNSLSYDEQKKLWACSEKIAQEKAFASRRRTCAKGSRPRF